jgi:DNA polymerase
MNPASAVQQLRVFDEMGLGPLWLSKYPVLAETTETAEAPETAVSARAEVEQPELAEVIKQPVQITPADTAPVVAVADELLIPELVPVRTDESIVEELMFLPVAEFDEPFAVADVQPSDGSRVSRIQSMDWQTLQTEVASCQQCGLCQRRANTVFGVGDSAAPWLFVGEGPGYNENLQGEPFVGAAGQLLDNMLRALGIARGQRAYIANIVKCRPTDDNGRDRPPSADEVAACLPYLQRQIALIQPRMIIALGKTAAVSLLGMSPETPVGQLRGRVHQLSGIPLVATYHPAYLLRKPADKAKAWQDLCLALDHFSPE